jgi:hypothetical protein
MRNLNLELRFTLLFGGAALLLSSIIGAIAGVIAYTILFRSLLLAFVFAAMGWLSVFVLKKYVPELYDFLNQTIGPAEAELSNTELSSDSEEMELNTAGAVSESDEEFPAASVSEKYNDGFEELNSSNFNRFSTEGKGIDGIDLDTGKLGKHIIEKNTMNRYEPKIMAQAVRTMMSRDAD